jgi:hypothetical protein
VNKRNETVTLTTTDGAKVIRKEQLNAVLAKHRHELLQLTLGETLLGESHPEELEKERQIIDQLRAAANDLHVTLPPELKDEELWPTLPLRPNLEA